MSNIQISNGTYLHIYIHEIKLSFEEQMLQGHIDFKMAAKDIIKAMGGHFCVALLEELHDACIDEITEHWTKFAKNRLEEDRYKEMKKFNNDTPK